MAIPLLCVVFVLVLLWLCVFCLFLLCCFWFAFLSVFLLGQLLDCVLVHYQHFCGFRQGDRTACKLQFNCLPRLNVCNDLAEAMKALDGKKSKSACKTSAGSSKILRWLTPLLGPNLDPKTGAKQRPKRRNEHVIQFWTPFWGPYLDPKMGSAIGEFRCCPHMLCKQICDPAART